MSELFIKIFNLSLSASWIVISLIILRPLLKRASAQLSCFLWSLVAIRLLFPFSIESVFSLNPGANTIPKDITSTASPAIDSGFKAVDSTVNPIISGSIPEGVINAPSPLQGFFDALSYIWFGGIILMLLWGAVSYARLRLKVRPSLLFEEGDGSTYICDNINTPFILGVIVPRIYLPSTLSPDLRGQVLAHENSHLRRKDHIWKLIGFILLSVYWFNPLVWLAYVLFCRDVELACDESVIKDMTPDERVCYSEALVACSLRKRFVTACPLAFGEVGVKGRIRSILSYKKPAIWIILGAALASVLVVICLLTDPIGSGDSTIRKIVYQKGYTIIDQREQAITLSIPKSALPDENLLEEEYEYDEGEVIAYQDNFTKIYLKKVLWDTDAHEYLILCYDFIFDPPKDAGSLIYPYHILENGFSDFCVPKDKSMRDDNTLYPNSIHPRGQGNAEKIWFYLSAEAMNKAEGKIEFDVYLNRITYVSDGFDGTLEIDTEGDGGASMVYFDPIYSFYQDPSVVPDFRVQYSQLLYTDDEGEDRSPGEVKIIELGNDNFDEYINYDPAKLSWLREENELTYELQARNDTNGIEVYYYMEQENGDRYVVYGHYENGVKQGVIRFIYKLP